MGDNHKVPSIEYKKYNFNQTPAILHLVNYHYIWLLINYRQDDEGKVICDKYKTTNYIIYQSVPLNMT